MDKPIKWKVTIAYNSDGKFLYESTEQDSWLAIAVATKQMFAKCHWLDTKETRITDVFIEDARFSPEGEHEDYQGDAF